MVTKRAAGTAPALFGRVAEILETARASVARTVNTTQVVANRLIGREIVEEEQHGRRRAGYGEQVVLQLAGQLTAAFGRGWSAQNLFYMKQFYATYPGLIAAEKILHAVRGESAVRAILHASRGESVAVPVVSAGGWTTHRLDAYRLRDIFEKRIWEEQLKPAISNALALATRELGGKDVSIVLLSGGSSNIRWLKASAEAYVD